jgi:hypothetical protein
MDLVQKIFIEKFLDQFNATTKFNWLCTIIFHYHHQRKLSYLDSFQI